MQEQLHENEFDTRALDGLGFITIINPTQGLTHYAALGTLTQER